MLREGILTSEPVNGLNWAEEVFYRRVMSVVDDYGRYYASPKLLRAACYPLHIDKVSDSDIGKWLTACVNAALVRVYPAQDGKRYLELQNFRQAVRAKTSKFPAEDDCLNGACDAGATQERCEGVASAPVGVVVGVIEDVGEKGPRKRGTPPKTPLPVGFAISDSVRTWAKAKGHEHLDEHLESFVRKCGAKGYTYIDWDKAFMNAIAEDWGKVRECAGKAHASAPVSPQPVRAAANRPSVLEELERDAKAVGLKRGIEESTTAFRLRVDEAMRTAEV